MQEEKKNEAKNDNRNEDKQYEVLEKLRELWKDPKKLLDKDAVQGLKKIPNYADIKCDGCETIGSWEYLEDRAGDLKKCSFCKTNGKFEFVCKNCKDKSESNNKTACLDCFLCMRQEKNQEHEKILFVPGHLKLQEAEDIQNSINKSIGTKADPIYEPWVCVSINQKNNEDIPDSWAVCESNFTPIDKQTGDPSKETLLKNFDEKQIGQKKNLFHSTTVNQKMCVRCFIKWNNFEFKQEKELQVDGTTYQKDYKNYKSFAYPSICESESTRIPKNGEISNKKKVQGMPEDEGSRDQEPSALEQGQIQIQNTAGNFIEKNVVPRMQRSQFKIHSYSITDDQEECFTKDLWQKAQNCREFKVLKSNIDYRVYKDQSIVIAQTYEMNQDKTVWLKTLQIMDPFMENRVIKKILLEALPAEIKGKKLPSFLQFKDFLYYFKRVYEDDKETESKYKKQKSHLQLNRCYLMYLLGDKKEQLIDEKQVEEFKIEEKDFLLCPQFNTCFGQKYIIYSEEETLNKVVKEDVQDAIKSIQEEFQKSQKSSILIDLNHMEEIEQASFSEGKKSKESLRMQKNKENEGKGDIDELREAAFIDGCLLFGIDREGYIEEPEYLSDYEKYIFQRNFFLLQRYCEMKYEDSDSDTEETQQIKKDEQAENQQAPNDANNKLETVGDKLQPTPYKNQIKVFLMIDIKHPVREMSTNIFIDETKKILTDEIAGDFFRTIDVTTSSFKAQEEYHNLKMDRGFFKLPKGEKEKNDVKKEQKLKTRATLIFSNNLQEYHFTYHIPQIDHDDYDDELGEEGLTKQKFKDQDKGGNDKIKYLIRKNGDKQDDRRKGSSMVVFSVDLKDIILPGQKTYCSYRQYFLLNDRLEFHDDHYHDHDHNHEEKLQVEDRLHLLYPSFKTDEVFKGKNQESQSETILQIKKQALKILNIQGDEYPIFSHSGLLQELSHKVKFIKKENLMSVWKDDLGIKAQIGHTRIIYIMNRNDRYQHMYILNLEDDKNTENHFLTLFERNLVLDAQSSSDQKSQKLYSQVVNQDIMEFRKDKNPDISERQKLINRIFFSDENLNKVKTLYLNSQNLHVMSSHEQVFIGDEEVQKPQQYLIEDIKIKGDYKKVTFDFNKDLKLEFYQRCILDWELFVFKLKDIFVFYYTNNGAESLSQNSDVKVLCRSEENPEENCQFIEKKLRDLNPKQPNFNNIHLTFERVVENSFQASLVPFIYAESENGEFGYAPKKQALVFFNCKHMQVIDKSKDYKGQQLFHVSINQSQDMNQDVMTENFRIQRSTIRSDHLNNKKEGIEQTVTSYRYANSFDNQGERFEITCISVYETKRIDNKLDDIPPQFRFTAKLEIIASEAEARLNGYTSIELGPLFDEKGENLVGNQFHKINNKEELFTFPIINIDKQQNQYQLMSDLVYIDIRKAFVRTSNDQRMQYLICAASLKQTVALSEMFTNQECFYLLNNTIEQQKNLIPFRFKDLFITETQITVDKFNFWKKRQILYGLTYSDLFLHIPTLISQALNQNEEMLENLEDTGQTLTFIEDFYKTQNAVILSRLEKLNYFSKDTMILQSDFNQLNQIQRALFLHSPKSINLIIDHIFSLKNDAPYQLELMKILPEIVDQKILPSSFVQFFGSSQSENESNELGQSCKLEKKLIHPNAPIFSKDSWKTYKIDKITNIQNVEDELVEILKKDQSQDGKGKVGKQSQDGHGEGKVEKQAQDGQQNSFDIDNTLIDFRYLILGMKLKKLRQAIEKAKGIEEEENKVIINEKIPYTDYELSQLIQKIAENPAVFDQQTVTRIIELQFEETQVAVKIQFAVFLMIYYLPLMIVFFNNNAMMELVVCSLGSVVMVFFLIIEIFQIFEQKWEYFKGEVIWNFIEISQFAAFVAFFLIRIQGDFEYPPPYKKDLLTIVLQFYLIAVGFFKVLFFIRIFSSFGQLVNMIAETVISMIPFIVFFFMWVILFAILFWILQVEISDKETDYLKLGNFIAYAIMTYRNSIGDISVPGYTNWDKSFSSTTPQADLGVIDSPDQVQDYSVQKGIVIALIWAVWLFNQFFNLIILLNFLIAVISQVYDSVMAKQNFLVYQHKASLNTEYFLSLKFLNRCKEYQMIIFQSQKQEDLNQEDVNLGFVQTLKSYMKKNITETNKMLLQMDKELGDKFKDEQDKSTQILSEISQTNQLFEMSLVQLKKELIEVQSAQQKMKNGLATNIKTTNAMLERVYKNNPELKMAIEN